MKNICALSTTHFCVVFVGPAWLSRTCDVSLAGDGCVDVCFMGQSFSCGFDEFFTWILKRNEREKRELAQLESVDGIKKKLWQNVDVIKRTLALLALSHVCVLICGILLALLWSS